jgi:hypothetical protein
MFLVGGILGCGWLSLLRWFANEYTRSSLLLYLAINEFGFG